MSVKRIMPDVYILIRPVSLSLGNGKCNKCQKDILKGHKMHSCLAKGAQWKCKLCMSCSPPPTPEMSAEEMRKIRRLIRTEWAEHLGQLQLSKKKKLQLLLLL